MSNFIGYSENPSDLCKVIDYVMIIQNSLEIISVKSPDCFDVINEDIQRIENASKLIHHHFVDLSQRCANGQC